LAVVFLVGDSGVLVLAMCVLIHAGIKDITHLKIDNFAFEIVKNFNYLVSILNADNKMNIEIAERIAKGNKTY